MCGMRLLQAVAVLFLTQMDAFMMSATAAPTQTSFQVHFVPIAPISPTDLPKDLPTNPTKDLPTDLPKEAWLTLVGSGASTVSILVHLAQAVAQRSSQQSSQQSNNPNTIPNKTIVLFEQEAAQWGKGVAYKTQELVHILNVPAIRMGINSQDPQHFYRWLQEQPFAQKDLQPTHFVPRHWYGLYLQEQQQHAITLLEQAGYTIHRIHAEVVDLIPTHHQNYQQDHQQDHQPHHPQNTLQSLQSLQSERVVLATGHLPPQKPQGIHHDAWKTGRIIRDIWTHTQHNLHKHNLHKDDTIVIVGTGLTAIDAALSLRAQGHTGHVHLVSRHGLLPKPHLDLATAPHPPVLPAHVVADGTQQKTARGMLKWWKHLRLLYRDLPWQTVMDSIRPHTTALWQSLPVLEQKRLLRRVRSVWEIHRHRAPLRTLETLQAWQQEGTLHLHKMPQIQVVTHAHSQVQTQVHTQTESQPESKPLHIFDAQVFAQEFAQDAAQIHADWVYLCTGANTDVSMSPSHLWQNLIRRRLAVPDPLRLGVYCDAAGHVWSDGAVHAGLYVIGGLRRGILWESTAVPDLVKQAHALVGEWVG